MGKTNKFWNFVMSDNNEEATLFLDGEISSDKSWWIDTITPAEFTRELQNLGDVKKITVHLNSGGGDVFAAHTIATRLKDHAAEIVVKTAWAASAATIIVAAADKSYMPSGGVYMIHNPKISTFGCFEAKDFIKMSEKLNVVKNSIVEWYKAKTGKDEKEICELMDNETWWTGKEAVENGFIDELLFDETEGENEPVLMNDNTAVVNSVEMDIANVPEKIKALFKPQKNTGGENIENSTNIKGGRNMAIKNVGELKAAYPELCNELVKNATEEERNRIKDIEGITLAGYEKMATKAKFEEPKSAAELSMSIIAAEKQAGKDYLEKVKNDTKTGGVNDVGAVATSGVKAGEVKDKAFDDVLNKIIPTEK